MFDVPRMLSVNFRKLVSRADLIFTKPVCCNESSLPIGNGQMGGLIWTSPNALHFQINRVDVFSSNSYTGSFDANNDYCGGCGFVDINFNDKLFSQRCTSQHLAIYDGLLTIEGCGIKTRMFVSHEQDVMVMEVNNHCNQPSSMHVDLRMLRNPVVKRRNHTATSKILQRGSQIVLTQKFVELADNGIHEGDHYCATAVAVGIVDRESSVQIVNDTTRRLLTEPLSGSFAILVSSAASMNPRDDVVGAALENLNVAQAKSFAVLLKPNQKWWHDFWSKSSIRLHSDDGVADALERDYTYYLYIMGCSSRGKYPPKFNGMIWCTSGDKRRWGSQYWWWNEQSLYPALFAANHLELMNPMFNMYGDMHDAAELAASQQWGSKGIFLPETVAFNGSERLPQAIAAELRDFLLERKSVGELSPAFRKYLKHRHPHSSRWNFLHGATYRRGKKRIFSPYSYVVHIFSSSAKIAYLYWLRYEYTLDERWLRNRAYPMLKGVAEFYRNYPNVKKGNDDKYHIHNVNSHEPLWGGQDTMEELAAMHGIFPLVIIASKILNVDVKMRSIWQEFLDNVAPLPTSDHPDAILFNRHPNATPTWAQGLKPYWKIVSKDSPTFTRPCVHYDLWTLETKDPKIAKIAHATFEAAPRYRQILAGHSVHGLSEIPITAAILGRRNDVRTILPVQANQKERFSNRLALDEGEQTQNVEAIGVVSYALQLALCQSIPAGPGKDPVIRLFAAWPKEWDAQYTLLCRRGFVITSSMQKGQIEFVEVTSQLGEECRLRNPWGNQTVVFYRNGKKGKRMSGLVLNFKTGGDEHIVMVPEKAHCRRNLNATNKRGVSRSNQQTA